VDPKEKAHVEEVLTQQYLERFPEYETTFKVYWVSLMMGRGLCDA
jgi:hypothetical protein